MDASKIGRFVYYAQWWFAILVPLFFFWGRAVFGAPIGWMAVVGYVVILPLVLVALIPPIVTRFDLTGRAVRATSPAYAIACIAGWSGGFVAGLGIPDGGDFGGTGSALSSLGMTDDASEAVDLIGIAIAVLGWGASLVIAISDAVASRRADAVG